MAELKETLISLFIVLLCIGLFASVIAIGSYQGNQDCWRGTARTVDCDFDGPCRPSEEHPRIIDVELNYAKRHPECRADWTEEQRRLAEAYWRGDGKDQ